MNKIDLQEKIFSRENIYAAIYSLDSYINEPNLLEEGDYKLFCELKDKHNKKRISNTIGRCKRKLRWVYKDNHLFNANVYFKLKGYRDGNFTFRPIHTCDLITQICIVAMLQPIMFLDDGVRSYSELSERIPENFYGNRPSIDIEYLYQKWQTAYKKYSDAIIDKTREYNRNNKFSHELNLDLKDFFPSVDPIIIINDLKNKCGNIYKDADFLEKTLVKLLYFRLNPKNLQGWQNTYYPDNPDIILNVHCTTRGIPQGLPQSPFFGNMIMTSIASILNEKVRGDALYYVDDSVIFTNISNKEFSGIVSTDINEAVCIKCGLPDQTDARDRQRSMILNQLGAQEKSFQANIKYKITFHSEGKSYIRPIAESFAANGNLSFLRRQVSMGASIYSDSNESEDISSLQKVTQIKEIIQRILKEEKIKLRREKADDIDSPLKLRFRPNTKTNENIANRIKLLRRHLRFFKFRELVLKYRQSGDFSKDYLESFERRFFKHEFHNEYEKFEYMENFDEDIFHSEYRFIINHLSENPNRLKIFVRNIADFEEMIAPEKAFTQYLYFCNDAKGCLKYRPRKNNSYDELGRIMHERFGMLQRTSEHVRRKRLSKFIHEVCSYSHGYKQDLELIPKYAYFVFYNAPQYRRMICNAACSEIFNVDVSDSTMLYKRTAQQISYNEFRILAYIRNRNFNPNDFNEFISNIIDNDANTILDAMPVDMSLTSILDIFIKYVSNPKHVDDLIQTHRIVSSLWKNGSKFLNDYTLHNEDHAICLIRQCVHICKIVDYLHLKHQDFYPLFLACYLHDISMVFHPDIFDFTQMESVTSEVLTDYKTNHKEHIENGIITQHDMLDAFCCVFEYFEKTMRNRHAHDSAKYIQNHAKDRFDYIEEAILQIVAKTGEAHGAEAVSVYNEKSHAKEALYSEKYLKILLRLADLLDMSTDRISPHRMQIMLNTMSKETQFHWISHLLTRNAELTTKYQYDQRLTNQNDDRTYIIYETIQINIYLRSLQMVSIDRSPICDYCHRTTFAASDIANVPPLENLVGIKISPDINNPPDAYCPLGCAWHMKKNQWLFNELKYLVTYLNSTNSRLFETSFEINFISCQESNESYRDILSNSTLEDIME